MKARDRSALAKGEKRPQALKGRARGWRVRD